MSAGRIDFVSEGTGNRGGIAGLAALKLLSRWLEGGRWKFFGIYCLAASAVVLAIHYKLAT